MSCSSSPASRRRCRSPGWDIPGRPACRRSTTAWPIPTSIRQDSFVAFCSEESLRLPDTFWCYEAPVDSPPVNALPAMGSGAITFGCLNNFCKVNEECLAALGRGAAGRAAVRLVPCRPRGAGAATCAGRAKTAAGCPRGSEWTSSNTAPRGGVPTKLYHRIDLALGSLSPYSGHHHQPGRVLDGVPTLTLVGRDRGRARRLESVVQPGPPGTGGGNSPNSSKYRRSAADGWPALASGCCGATQARCGGGCRSRRSWTNPAIRRHIEQACTNPQICS